MKLELRINPAPKLALAQKCPMCGQAINKADDRADMNDVLDVEVMIYNHPSEDALEPKVQCPKCGRYTRRSLKTE